MVQPLVLASASPTRAQLLRQAGLEVAIQPARVDEAALSESLLAEDASPRDIADALAEHKALRVAARHPGAITIGADQVLDLRGEILTKPATIAEARAQIDRLRGETHRLHSAVVLYRGAQPLWRHVGVARLTMRDVSDAWRESYLQAAWPGISGSVGSYQIEGLGVRLFSQIEGDYFTILGLPLIPLLAYLSQSGAIPS